MKKGFITFAFLLGCFFCFPFGINGIKAKSATAWVEAKAECVMEAHSRRILYESRGDTRLPMASTTKILTAITVLDACENIEDTFEIPAEAVGIEGSSVYLKSGDIYSVKDLLYGLMLRSGNDCATALALRCSESVDKFSTRMNLTAQKAGALCSNFKNPHGLPCKGHYTTARDLTLITCYAMENPTFREIVATQYYAPCGWKNKNKMLTQYEGGIGVKTGYTKEAGRCLVSAAERENMTLVCTVLNCSTTYERSAKLLDDAFDTYKYVPLIKEGDELSVEYGGKSVLGKVKENFYYPLSDGEEQLIQIKTKPLNVQEKGRNKDKIIGQFEIYLAKRLLFSGNLYKL